MKSIRRRILSLALSAALMCGMAVSASAFTYPSAYWKLHSAWDEAVSAQNLDQIISVAQQTYDLLMPYGLGTDVCYNLEPKCAQAAWACEIKGDLQGAVNWLNRQLTFAQWLDQNVSSYQDTLLNVNARLEYLNAAMNPQIYTLTDQAGPSYPGSGAPASGTWYGSDAGGSQTGESAVLMYVDFMDGYSVEYWLDYHENTQPKFAQALQGGAIELAWNFSPESTAGAQRVLSADADSYIADGLRAMGELDATVLLRIGAEMNNWSDCDPAVYIQAFQKIARQARQYDNIKLVFSPDNVSNRNVSFQDFYPGDEYVDWIGVSTYHNSNYASYNGGTGTYSFSDTKYSNDAYYGMGIYDSDPLTILRPIADFAQTHGKPMMISECGFGYRNNSTGADQTAFAVDQLNKFYSYVNMIYPQVKAVFYFDTALSGAAYSYSLAGSSSVQQAYRSAIANNGAYLAQGQTEGKSWQSLSAVKDAGSSALKLATHAIFPGSASTSVTYYVDGAAVATVSQAPYYYELNPASLTPGQHTIRAQATSGQFSQSTPTYQINVMAPGQIFPDVAPGAWYASFVQTAYEKGLFSGNADGTFAPESNMTYAQFLVVLSQFSGDTISPVEGGVWYDGYVNWAKEQELIPQAMLSGFDPNAAITRQDMAALFGTFLEAYNPSYEVVNDQEPSFPDQGAIADYAADGVTACLRAGIMSGNADGSFNPTGTATRAQVAVTMVQMARVMGK